MDKWTLQHLLFPSWWAEASEDIRADWNLLILPFPEHTYSVSAACMLGAVQTIRVSYCTDLSNMGAASPWWLCCMWLWRNTAWCRDRHLPCPAQPAVSSSLHQRGVCQSSASPGAAATPLPPISSGVSSKCLPTCLVSSLSVTLAITCLTNTSVQGAYQHEQANVADFTLLGLQWKWMNNMQRQAFCVWVARASMVIRAASPRMSWTLLEAHLLHIFTKLSVKKTVQEKYWHDRQESCTLYHICWAQLGCVVEYLVDWVTLSAI